MALGHVKGGGLSSGYGFTSEGGFEKGDESSQGRTKLPGNDFVQSFRPQGQELKARHVALKQRLIEISQAFHPLFLHFPSSFRHFSSVFICFRRFLASESSRFMAQEADAGACGQL